jgi:parallel beta-helix repeat protein
VNGSAQGNGSAAQPWRTLREVIEAGLIETRSSTGTTVNAGAPVKAGSTLLLRSGFHGDVLISNAFNTSPITIAAEAGHTPRLQRLTLRSVGHWIVRGLHVSPEFASTFVKPDHIVTVNRPATDIVLDGLTVFSKADSSTWTSSQWLAFAAHGMDIEGDRITVRNNTVRNVYYGIHTSATNVLVERNLIENFCGDGARTLGDNATLQYNTIRNSYSVNDEHRDGIQSWSVGSGGVGTGEVRNVVLRGNLIVSTTRPATLDGDMQGIGLFDGTFVNWVIENNVVVTNHWHGISIYGARDSRIVNNTVVDSVAGSPGPAWILVARHKNGTASQNVVVRNNLTQYGVSIDSGQSVVSDHNLTVSNPSTFFVNFAGQDFRLPAGSPAIDAGSSTLAPNIDIAGTARPQGAAVDLGAYERIP